MKQNSVSNKSEQEQEMPEQIVSDMQNYQNNSDDQGYNQQMDDEEDQPELDEELYDKLMTSIQK